MGHRAPLPQLVYGQCQFLVLIALGTGGALAGEACDKDERIVGDRAGGSSCASPRPAKGRRYRATRRFQRLEVSLQLVDVVGILPYVGDEGVSGRLFHRGTAYWTAACLRPQPASAVVCTAPVGRAANQEGWVNVMRDRQLHRGPRPRLTPWQLRFAGRAQLEGQQPGTACITDSTPVILRLWIR